MQRFIFLLAMLSCGEPDSEPGGVRVDAPAAPQGLPGPDLAPDALLAHLTALGEVADAHDGNRAFDTSGYEASVDYVIEQLELSGLAPWIEEVPVSDFELYADPVLVDTTLPSEWAYGDDIDVLVYTAAGDVTAEAVPVDLTLPPGDAGGSTSGCEPEDFVDFPPGAIALIQRGTCSFALKVRNAELARAAGVIVFNEGQRGRRDPVSGTLDADEPPLIPAVGASFAVGEALAEGGHVVHLVIDAEMVEVPTWNVLVDVQGASGMWWSVGAHLDSVPEGPGINDNGTGVATLLELARWSASAEVELEHGIRFGFWGAEEIGLVGSLHHARTMSEDDLALTLGNLNFDMVGSPNPGRFVYDGDQSDYAAPPFLEIPPGTDRIEALFIEHFDGLDLPHDPIPFEGRTDYLGFAQLGLPVGGLFTGAEMSKDARESARYGGEADEAYDACYHQFCDDTGNIHAEMFEQMAEAAGAVLHALTSEPAERAFQRRLPGVPSAEIPRWVPWTCDGEFTVR